MISSELIERVLSQAQLAASRSWEHGIVYEALLEYYNPSISVFNDPFPNGTLPVVDKFHVPALEYVQRFILTDGHQLCEGDGKYLLIRGSTTGSNAVEPYDLTTMNIHVLPSYILVSLFLS